MIHELKATFPASQKNLPFGIDLALPKVGAGARATNHDYTNGQLDALIDVVIEERATLFVSAVGVPPTRIIDKLHRAGVVVMNMVGAPKHAEYALQAGVDIVCAQGGEGGGHTGEIPTGVLVPAVVDVARRYRPVMLGGAAAMVVAAGGIYNGRSVAASLMQGAVGVWVGTRFVASEEAGCSRAHKEAVVGAGYGDTVRTLVVTGRPLRCRVNGYIRGWEERPDEIRRLTGRGVVPMMKDMDEGLEEVDFPYLMGQVAGAIGEVKPARVIVEEMVKEAVEMLRVGQGYIGGERNSKL